MICPICDKALTRDEVLMLTDDNKIEHRYWDMEDQSWVELHSSRRNVYQVSIDWRKQHQ